MHKKIVLLVICCMLYSSQTAFAQKFVAHTSTTEIENSRYDIVQSTLTIRDTFKLDTYTGTTWQLVKDKEDNLFWEVIPCCNYIIHEENAPRYKIFLSSMAARATYLLDTFSGQTWNLVLNKDNYLIWSTIKE